MNILCLGINIKRELFLLFLKDLEMLINKDKEE